MKRTILCCVLGASSLLGCSGDDDAPNQPNDDMIPPQVTLAASADSLDSGNQLTLNANVTDDGTISSIAFYQNGVLIGTQKPRRIALDASSSDSRSFTHVVSGTYQDNGDHHFHAVASDAAGNSGTSDTVQVVFRIPAFPFDEPFDDGSIDPLLWRVIEDGGPTVSESNGRFEIEVPASSSGNYYYGGIETVCHLTGDFDVEVGFEALDWPSQAGIRLAISVPGGSAGRASFYNDFAPSEAYFAHHITGVTTVGSTDLSGKLRITRSGDTWTSFYWDGSDWQVIESSVNMITDSHSVILQAWGHDFASQKVPVRIAFDDFKLNSGTVVCP